MENLTNERSQGKLYGMAMSHARRISLECLNLFANHDRLFKLIGFVNKYVKLIGFIFMVYPANDKYALKYVYRRRLPVVRWNPWPCGILWQNGKIGIMFCVSSTNGQFSAPENEDNLRKLSGRMEQLRLMFHAERKTFAGIVPGVLVKKNIIPEAPESELTADAVKMAYETLKEKEKLGDDSPVIVLGGEGNIGRRVMKRFSRQNVCSVDIQDGKEAISWQKLQKKRGVVINITLNSALSDYVDIIPPGTVVLNEVYPEPSSDVLEELRRKNCPCYHVVGIKGRAFPPFPKAYKGAIPCCAARPSKKMKVIVKLLN